jgi:hypothetical protein
MASILDSLTQVLSSSVTQDIGKAVGLQPDLVSKGMGVVGPLITTALAQKASTAGGLADIMKVLPKDDTTSILGNLAGLVKGGGGTQLLSSVFGGGSNAVTTSLNRVLGFDASSLLRIATPLVLGFISKIAREKKLDSAGVANLLASEAAEFEKSGSSAVRVVRDAVDTGRKAEDTKARYSSVQWESVRLAPVAAAHLVMMADKSGPIGAAKEISAAASVIDDVRKQAAPTSVLSLAFETELSAEELVKYAKDKSSADAIAIVREAIELVDKNNPADGPNFRQLVADVANKVANASKEGGILGIGGTLVSESEQKALDQINSVTGRR